MSARDDESTWRARDGGAGGERAPALAWTDRDGKHLEAIVDRALVGSASRAAIAIADKTVSRLHAEVVPAGEGVWVRDLESLNGTWAEGLRIKEAFVPIGRRIRLGDVEVTIAEAAAPASEPWRGDSFGPLVGSAPSMRALFAHLARVASSDAAVLVRGETGTGKELCARAIHDASARRDGPFVVIDCAALPESLLEAELFGHARGAFTGATAARAGAFEAAGSGTVFLDEIGELPLTMQPKLLRVLESKTVRRIGETEHRRVDVRVVSATHRDLATMVTAGAFREDLFFRLAVLPVTIPPLRERPDDIERLLDSFFEQRARDFLGAEVIDAIVRLPWLGNVRELRNFAERVRALGADAALALARAGGDQPLTTPAARMAPPEPPSPEGSFRAFRERAIDQSEAYYVRALMSRHGRNVSLAAKEAGMNRSHLYRLLKKHGV